MFINFTFRVEKTGINFSLRNDFYYRDLELGL